MLFLLYWPRGPTGRWGLSRIRFPHFMWPHCLLESFSLGELRQQRELEAAARAALGGGNEWRLGVAVAALKKQHG